MRPKADYILLLARHTPFITTKTHTVPTAHEGGESSCHMLERTGLVEFVNGSRMTGVQGVILQPAQTWCGLREKFAKLFSQALPRSEVLLSLKRKGGHTPHRNALKCTKNIEHLYFAFLGHQRAFLALSSASTIFAVQPATDRI